MQPADSAGITQPAGNPVSATAANAQAGAHQMYGAADGGAGGAFDAKQHTPTHPNPRVPNPRDPRGGYDMDYCLVVAKQKNLFTPEMQQMAAQLNVDRNHVHHHPFADVSTGSGPVASVLDAAVVSASDLTSFDIYKVATLHST